MSGDESYPTTVGQLSVWRDIEKMPPERRWEANLAFVWDLPRAEPIPDGPATEEPVAQRPVAQRPVAQRPVAQRPVAQRPVAGGPAAREPLTEQRVWAALDALAARHASLRTIYSVDEHGFPRQRLLGPDSGAQVRQGTADVARRAALETAELQRAIDVTREPPWRAWILTDAGRPAQVLVVVNHMATDGVGSVVLNEDFLRLLAGEALPPAPGPLELALDQQGEGGGRLRNSERYWRRTMAAAPRRREPDGAAGRERVGATLHTGIPMPLVHDGAAKLDVGPAGVLLAAYCRAVCAVTGEPTLLMFPMTANRLDERHARVVTSLNQWVPLLLDVDPAEPFEAAVPKVHWKTFNALKHGICSPDAILAIRAEHADADPGYYHNPILAPPDFPSTDPVAPSTVDWYEPARATGPGFYVISRGLTSLDLLVRVDRPGWDRPRVEAFLRHVQDTLADTCGGHRLP